MILNWRPQAGRQNPQQAYSNVVNFGRAQRSVGTSDAPPVVTGAIFWNRHRPGPVGR